jgi:hypothetical protein
MSVNEWRKYTIGYNNDSNSQLTHYSFYVATVSAFMAYFRT